MFIYTFGAEYYKAKCSGKYGCIPEIWKALRIRSTTQIAYILEDVLQFIKDRFSYTVERQPRKYGHVGRKPSIPIESLEAQIIYDCIEYCLFLLDTLNAVNLHREEQREELLTMSDMCTTVASLKPKLLKVSSIIQGNKDPTSPWYSS